MAEYEEQRTVTIALNADGVADISECRGNTPNLEYVDIPSEEFWSLHDSGVIWELNRHYGLMLDDFESGTIKSDFGFLLDEFKKVEGECPILFDAVSRVGDLRTSIHFDF